MNVARSSSWAAVIVSAPRAMTTGMPRACADPLTGWLCGDYFAITSPQQGPGRGARPHPPNARKPEAGLSGSPASGRSRGMRVGLLDWLEQRVRATARWAGGQRDREPARVDQANVEPVALVDLH